MRRYKILFLLLIIQILHVNAQFPEDFEGTFPPTGWTINNNGIGFGSQWISSTDSFSGDNAAVIPFEDISPDSSSEDWLITPRFKPTSAANVFTFYQKQLDAVNYSSTFSIMVSENADSTILGDYVELEAQAESSFEDLYVLHSVSLSAYDDKEIFVAFVSKQDDGDSWFVDKVNLESPSTTVPLCVSNPSPLVLELSATVLASTLTLAWDAPVSGFSPSSYEVYTGTSSGVYTEVAEISGTSYLIPVSYSTEYFWKIIPKNFAGSASSCSEWNFTTQSSPGIPVNDDCANAISILSAPYVNIQDATFATNNSGVILDCAPGMNDGVWYTFTPGNSGMVNIDVLDVIGFNVAIGVYTGSCGIFICEEFGNVNFTNEGESISVSVESGKQYWINIGSHDFSNYQPEGAFKISLSLSGGATLGIGDSEKYLEVNLFPNPTRNRLNISHASNIDVIRVYDLLGCQVMIEKPNNKNIEMDMSRLPSGMYIVEVYSENKKGSYRVIKQ